MRSDVVAIVIVVLAASAAHAEAADEARSLYDAGEAAFTAGRYDDALTEFSLAYKADPKAGFLFNIGQCHRKLGHHAEARDAFSLYLEKLPAAPNRAAVLELIAEESAAASPKPPTTPATTTTPTTTTTPATTTPATTPATTATTTTAPAGDEGGWVMPVAIGAGVVVAVATIAAIVIVAQPPAGTNLGVIDLR